jgi:hypothetical protein
MIHSIWSWDDLSQQLREAIVVSIYENYDTINSTDYP